MNGNAKNYVINNKENIKSTLETLVNINSQTLDKTAVDSVGREILKILDTNKIAWDVYKHNEFGDLIVAKVHKSDTGPNILLSAHTDMVVPSSEHIDFKEDSKFFYGSGIQDLKGGVTAMVYTLLYFALNNLSVNVTAVFTPDEERGSQAHKNTLYSIYSGNDYAFIYEPTKKDPKNTENFLYRTVITERKGILVYKITTFGKNTHSGSTTKKAERISAISELIHIARKVENLANYKKGTTVNIGLISGGISVNTIAGQATMEFDVRFKKAEEYQRVKEKVSEICSKTFVSGASNKYDLLIEVPPLEVSVESKSLAMLLKGAAKDYGIKIAEEYRGGGSDANQISQFIPAVIDGMGPSGFGTHDPQSSIYKESLYQSIYLSIASIDRIVNLYSEEAINKKKKLVNNLVEQHKV